MDPSTDTMPFSPGSLSGFASPNSSAARASMMRPRPRLPAGPRSRTKQQSLLGQQEGQASDRHQSLMSFTMSPPLSPTPLPPALEEELDQTLEDASASAPAPVSPVASVPEPPAQTPAAPAPIDTASVSITTEALSPVDSVSKSSPSSTPRDRRPPPLPIVSLNETDPTESTSSYSPRSPFPPSRPATPATPTMSTIKVIPRAPTLPQLPPISFVPPPLPYKHLTLDAAHWTLTSAELQTLVSAAIRESAKEKFIQLLPPSVVEGQLEDDAVRVEKESDGAAARWRFDVTRRNMLVRGLSSAAGQEASGSTDAIHALLSQLVSTLAALDGNMQTLLHSAEHRAQLTHARDIHRASALAVALRKLNASYARRTKELERARERIGTLEVEVEEAWKVAEDVAAEVDRLKGVVTSMEMEMEASERRRHEKDKDRMEEAFRQVEDDVKEDHLEPADASSEDEGFRDMDGLSVNDFTSVSRAEVVGVMGTAVVTKARLTSAPTTSPTSTSASSPTTNPPTSFPLIDPTAFTPSASNKRFSTASQVSRVSAARKRSLRASKASLRIPHARSLSNVRGESIAAVPSASTSDKRSVKSKASRKQPSVHLHPPMPGLPADSKVAGADEGEGGTSSFLEMEGRTTGEEDADAEADAEADGDADGEQSGDDNEPLVFSPPATEPPEGPNPHRFTYPPKLQIKRPRSPTTNLLASYFSPSNSLSAAPAGLLRPASVSSAAPSLSTSAPTTETTSTVSGARPAPVPVPAKKTHHASVSSFPDVDAFSDSQAHTDGPARRGRSLELPLQNAGRLRRSMSELLRFGTKSRRRSVPVGFSNRRLDMAEDEGEGAAL
ncbi:hypothetical protein FA95DRAFT_1595737 [Auriscalpium vulgare]|uniref:Uncharacterized protein n=1 Tax=Auriscalpium vulgare TaxID=40419 RepID=A0ACB8RTP1_9AGAM|nr:hypothetical protein FA95DRAFT_1595737 [Auriscalpium vulgare]